MLGWQGHRGTEYSSNWFSHSFVSQQNIINSEYIADIKALGEPGGVDKVECLFAEEDEEYLKMDMSARVRVEIRSGKTPSSSTRPLRSLTNPASIPFLDTLMFLYKYGI
ncbi:hypothetical protein CJ030_MR4G020925 [Morella rubra]|uniref:Uncharacterized protein n=1 Tax=Morella rubra TaxID=262757 RepID=A0A6A1VZB2_9ROSI|nr:hypothetical protein CJ030_MR4G020925 [Morella rubra]